MGGKKIWLCDDCGEKFSSAGRLADHQAYECIERLERLVREGKVVKK